MLQRLTATGAVAATLGTLNDTGTGGDAVPGDRIFTLQFTLNEPVAANIPFRISAAISGQIARTFSPILTVTVNPIVNGGFEQGPSATLFARLNPGSTAITGWTVISATVDYNTTIWSASEGTRSVDLDGEIGHAGGVEQTFTTVPGLNYLVNFDMAGNPDGGPSLKRLRVSAAGQVADFAFDTTGLSRTNMGWVTRSWVFAANASSTSLAFQSLNGSGYGAALDNVRVSVTALPIPSIVQITPAIGMKGTTLDVTINGASTNWLQGLTTVDFGHGVTVQSVTVSTATRLAARISIDPAAVEGPRTVVITTSAQVLTLPGGFAVASAASISGVLFQLSVPSTGGLPGGNPTSTPAPGRTVHLYRGQTRAATLTTNQAGEFNFQNQPPGPFQLIGLDGSGRIGSAAGNLLSGQPAVVNVTIAGAAFVAISVRDIRGNPVPSAPVTLDIESFPVPSDFAGLFHRTGTANGLGFIQFAPVPNGELLAAASRPGGGLSGRAAHFVGPDGTVEIDLYLDPGETSGNLLSLFNNTFPTVLASGRNETYGNLVSLFNHAFPTSLTPGRNEAYGNLISLFNDTFPLVLSSGRNETYGNVVSVGNGPTFLPALPTLSSRTREAINAGDAKAPPPVHFDGPGEGSAVVAGQTIRLAANEPSAQFMVNGVPFESEDGSLLFTVPAGLSRLTFRAVSSGRSASEERTVHVQPDRGISVRGRVLDTEQRPVSGARVVIGYHGLRAEYFDFETPLTAVPDVSKLHPGLRRTVTALNMRNPAAVFGLDPFGLGMRPDFAARYRGWFLAPAAGEYRFTITASGGARLIVNGNAVAETVGTAAESGAVGLAAGPITIEVIHYENVGPAELRLSVTPPGGACVAVPPLALWAEDSALATITGPTGEFVIPNVPRSLERVRAIAAIEKGGVLITGASEGVALPETVEPVDLGTVALIPKDPGEKK